MSSAQFIGFTLCSERYAADITRIQEIKSFDAVTGVPCMPSYLLGVANLRGTIVPVIDLRARLDLGRASAGSVILVLRVRHAGGERTAAVVVDSVDDVLTVGSDSIQPLAEVVCVAARDFIYAVACTDDHTWSLIDLEALINQSIDAA